MNNEILGIKMLNFKALGDERGMITICECGIDIPFVPKRVFYIYQSSRDITRGKHANRISDFVLINLNGMSKVRVLDNDGNMQIFSLNEPNIGIFIPHMVWMEMYDFSMDSVLLCLASEHYDPNEYIRDFDEYKREASN